MPDSQGMKLSQDDVAPRHSGSCVCGSVYFEVTGNLRDVVCCHCTECRKHTGHFMAATAAKLSNVQLLKTTGLKWYRSSDRARRAFCSNCGSTLFWRRDGADYIAISAGSLNGRTGLNIVAHVYCIECGDYYDISENVARFDLSSGNAIDVP